VLEDSRWSHSADSILEPGRGEAQAVDPTVRLLRASILFNDGRAHAQHLRVIEPAFKGLIKGIDERIERTARGLVAIMREKGSDAELMHDFAGPLALVTVADLMGVPAKDRAMLDRWGRDLAMGLDPSIGGRRVARADAASAAIVEFFLDSIDAAASHRTPGLISELIDRRGKLGTFEIIADLVAMFVTGVQASSGLIGNGVLALLRNPDQLDALRARPALMKTAVEELARYDSPVHLTARVAESDVEFGTASIAAGEQVLLLLGAANRDPDRFPNPDRLDLSRKDTAHLAFGAGTHMCFARPLATAMAAAAITTLANSLPALALAGEPEWNPTVTLRVLAKLPVAIG
jgi:cytochrome P450